MTEAEILAKYGRQGWTVIERRPDVTDKDQPASAANNYKPIPAGTPTKHTVWQIKAPQSQAGTGTPAIEEMLVDVVPSAHTPGDPEDTNLPTLSYTQVPNGEPRTVSPGQMQAPKDTSPFPGGVHTNGKGQLVGIKADGSEQIIDASVNASTNAPNPYPGGVHQAADGSIIGVGADGKSVTIQAGGDKTPYPGGVHVAADGRVLGIKADGTVVVVDPGNKSAYPGGVHTAADGSLVGVKADGSTVTIAPAGKTRTLVTGADGHVMSVSTTDPKDVVDTGITGDASALLVVTNTTSKKLTIINKNTGEVVGTFDNPSYMAPKDEELTPNTVAPFIHTLKTNPDGTQSIVSTPNDNQLTVSQAMMQVLYPQIAAAMTNGTMDAQTAKDFMSAADAKTKTDISALKESSASANSTLTNLNAGAKTGADFLQARATGAKDITDSLEKSLLSNPNFGLGKSLGPNFAANLVNGAGAWMTDLGGGQANYDAASHMVQANDPTSSLAAPAYAQLAQNTQNLSNLYTNQFGGAHPNLPPPQPGVTPPAAPGQEGGDSGVMQANPYPNGVPPPVGYVGNNSQSGFGGPGFPSGPTDQQVEQYADQHKDEPGMNWDAARAFLTPQPGGN